MIRFPGVDSFRNFVLAQARAEILAVEEWMDGLTPLVQGALSQDVPEDVLIATMCKTLLDKGDRDLSLLTAVALVRAVRGQSSSSASGPTR